MFSMSVTCAEACIHSLACFVWQNTQSDWLHMHCLQMDGNLEGQIYTMIRDRRRVDECFCILNLVIWVFLGS